MNLYATAAFGMEGLVADELKRLKMKNVRPENGGVRFEGDQMAAFYCNLRLRFGDRVMILLAEAECQSFEDLFQLISSIPWETLTRGDEAFNVSCKCARSRLMSPRDCQSITKKAIIERLKRQTRRSVFPENGAPLPVHLSIHDNLTKVLLDTSGEALSRRGYRTWNGEAPLRETLASALVEMSPWRPGMPLYDPCCGTGTILIEAALRAGHRAPGMNRPFAMEGFSFFDADKATALRQQVKQDFEPERIHNIAGSDIDPEALELAKRHVHQAGLDGRLQLQNADLRQLQLKDAEGVFICNPPYGERLSDLKSCEKLYAELHKLKDRHPGWSLCAISSDPAFEQAYGQRADRKRRLYNGRLECNFYIYLK